MTRSHKRILFFVIIALLGIYIAVQLSRPDPIAVTVQAVERGDVEATVANTRAGTVKACRRAGLSPAIGGQITQLEVSEGDQVEKGQLLLALWNEDLQAQVDLAAQEARAAEARAEAICLQADVAQREAQRLQRIEASGAVSDERVDQAVTHAKAAKADCHSAQANADVSQARINVAKANLARTLLIAPFNGVVAEINAELNEYVTPSPPGIATLPAIDLLASACFYVSAPIDEVDAAAIEVGMPARISLDAFDDQQFPARVRRIADYVLDLEKQARTVAIEVEFEHNDTMPALLAGYSADAEVILSAKNDSLRIPTLAVMEGPKVMVFNPNSQTLELRDIEIGISNWDFTEVTAGLDEGEQVITSLDRPGVEAGAYARIETDQP